MGYAIKSNGEFRSVSPDMELEPGEEYYETLPEWVLELEILYENTQKLNILTRQASTQVSALNGRIVTLEWLINEQDSDDPDYIEPTEEEILELPVRKSQLTKWNTYSAKLGRVKLQATWPITPVWPAMPEPYNTEMSRGT